jgi:hypothetical protein
LLFPLFTVNTPESYCAHANLTLCRLDGHRALVFSLSSKRTGLFGYKGTYNFPITMNFAALFPLSPLFFLFVA